MRVAVNKAEEIARRKAVTKTVLISIVILIAAALLETEFSATNPCVEALKEAGAVKDE